VKSPGGVTNRGDVAQCSAFQSVPTRGQPTSFVIGQPQSPTQLSSEDSILFDQVGHASRCRRFRQPARTARNNRADVRSTTAGVFITDRPSNLRSFGRGVGHYERRRVALAEELTVIRGLCLLRKPIQGLITS
jgi:hypothetical protein